MSFWLVVLKIIGALLLFWFFTYTLSKALMGIAAAVPVAAPAPSGASLQARVAPLPPPANTVQLPGARSAVFSQA